MYVLTLECPEGEVELVSAELWDNGASGILEEPLPAGLCLLKAWFAEPGTLVDNFKAFNPRLAAEAVRDWEAEARQAWQPFEVGRMFYLAPEWDESPAPEGRLRLTIHPGMALGTGAHPATKLCLAALETVVDRAAAVLDVGCGSGILTAGAHILGAERAVGCDIEHDAVAVARRNLLADGVAPRVFTGSLRSVAMASFDVIVANINAASHLSLSGEYERVSRGGLIVSGFQAGDEERVKKALGGAGFRVTDRSEEEGWVCLCLSKEENS